MKKGMMELYLSALSQVSKLKLTNVNVQLVAKFELDQFAFSITVFNRDKGDLHNNTHFFFYAFQKLKHVKEHLAQAIDLIKTDDFALIKEGKEAIELK